MSLRLYNTLTRQKEEFKTLEAGKVRMYVCGPTVYADAHIGHAMAAIVFDMIRRYLIYRGYQVRYATNFTDVDDKIIRRANETGQDPIQMANHFANKYLHHLGDLNVMPADIYPKVSETMRSRSSVSQRPSAACADDALPAWGSAPWVLDISVSVTGRLLAGKAPCVAPVCDVRQSSTQAQFLHGPGATR